jgi:hypothetical protein
MLAVKLDSVEAEQALRQILKILTGKTCYNSKVLYSWITPEQAKQLQAPRRTHLVAGRADTANGTFTANIQSVTIKVNI